MSPIQTSVFSETALEFVLTAESRHFCAVMAQKATSLGKFLRNLLKNRLCCRFFKTLPLNETAPSYFISKGAKSIDITERIWYNNSVRKCPEFVLGGSPR